MNPILSKVGEHPADEQQVVSPILGRSSSSLCSNKSRPGVTRVPINALAPFSQQDQMSRIDLCSTAQTANLLLTNKKTQMKSLAISSLELAVVSEKERWENVKFILQKFKQLREDEGAA